MPMEDSSRGRSIDKIIHRVFSGIDWEKQQFKSSCPPRERWSWQKIWDWMHKYEKKKDEFEKHGGSTESHQHFSQTRENKNIDTSMEYNELSRWGYQYCEIKMQNPCAPCCCEIECIEPPSCTEIPRIDRTPRCECAQRKIIKIGRKCCDTTSFEMA